MNLSVHLILFGLVYCNGLPSSDSSNVVLDGALPYGIPLEAREECKDDFPSACKSPKNANCEEYTRVRKGPKGDICKSKWWSRQATECGDVPGKIQDRCKVSCNVCVPSNHCTDGRIDGDETGRDCGGKDCPPCQRQCGKVTSTFVTGIGYMCGAAKYQPDESKVSPQACWDHCIKPDKNYGARAIGWQPNGCACIYQKHLDKCPLGNETDWEYYDFNPKHCTSTPEGCEVGQCCDLDFGAKSHWEENGCDTTNCDPGDDDDDFQAEKMCCECGGGAVRKCKDELPSTCTYPPNACAKLLKNPKRRAKWCDRPLSSRKKCGSDATGLIRDHCMESCKVCTPTDHCTDGRINGDETEIDCGGKDCPTCKRQCGKATSSFVTKIGTTYFSDKSPEGKESPQKCWDLCIKPGSIDGYIAIAWKPKECACVPKKLVGKRIVGNEDDWEYYDFNPNHCTSTPAGCNANECCDLNFGATDRVKNGCDKADCTGGWDVDDFQAEKMCCKCGGGTTTLE